MSEETLIAEVEDLKAKLAALQPRPLIEDVPAEPGFMKQATVTIALHKDATIVKTGVTPAQLQVLVVAHMSNVGGEVIKALDETEPVKRTPTQEIARLRSIYGVARIKALYGPNSTLPATFNEANSSGKSWAMENPGEAMDDTPLVGRKMNPTEAAAFA